ncbi:MAG: tetratricopeptide repeat protein [Chloroflexi bacterium]|nr:tetratricopeptide repeat protein [Chloroflexota bacterium]
MSTHYILGERISRYWIILVILSISVPLTINITENIQNICIIRLIYKPQEIVQLTSINRCESHQFNGRLIDSSIYYPIEHYFLNQGEIEIAKELEGKINQSVIGNDLRNYDHGLILYEQGLKDLALQTWRSSPIYKTYFRILGDNYLAKNENSLAIKSYNLSLEIDPSQWDIYIAIGRINERNGNYDEAISWCAKALTYASSWTSYLCLGENYYYLGNYGIALEQFQKAVSLDENNTTLYWLGRTQIKVGNIVKAISSLQKAISLGSGSILGWYYYDLAQAFELNNDLDNAEKTYELFLRIAPKNPYSDNAKKELERINAIK